MKSDLKILFSLCMTTILISGCDLSPEALLGGKSAWKQDQFPGGQCYGPIYTLIKKDAIKSNCNEDAMPNESNIVDVSYHEPNEARITIVDVVSNDGLVYPVKIHDFRYSTNYSPSKIINMKCTELEKTASGRVYSCRPNTAYRVSLKNLTSSDRKIDVQILSLESSCGGVYNMETESMSISYDCSQGQLGMKVGLGDHEFNALWLESSSSIQ